MSAAAGWQRIEVEPGIGFTVPPDARRAHGFPVDSVAGVLDGEGYRVAFDLGRFGERLHELEGEPAFQSAKRAVAGRIGREVTFEPSDEPFACVRIVQLDVGDGRTLTLRVSCNSWDRCSLADRIFDSIAIERTAR